MTNKTKIKTKLITFGAFGAGLLMLTTNIILPLAEAQGKKLGTKYNLSESIYRLTEHADFSLSFPKAKAEEPKQLSTEERYWQALKTDVEFRAYIVNMVVKRNNPGNVRFANQPFSIDNNGFAEFPDTITGFRALIMQIEEDTKRGDTIKTFIEDYAPSSENNTAKYIADVSDLMGVDKETKLQDLDRLQLSTVITGCEHSLWY